MEEIIFNYFGIFHALFRFQAGCASTVFMLPYIRLYYPTPVVVLLLMLRKDERFYYMKALFADLIFARTFRIHVMRLSTNRQICVSTGGTPFTFFSNGWIDRGSHPAFYAH